MVSVLRKLGCFGKILIGETANYFKITKVNAIKVKKLISNLAFKSPSLIIQNLGKCIKSSNENQFVIVTSSKLWVSIYENV